MPTLKTLTETALWISIASAIIMLTGCSTSGGNSSVLPQGGKTMSQIYDNPDGDNTGEANSTQLDSVRAQVPQLSGQNNQTREEAYAPVSDAPRYLPNPIISIYVYSHFAGDDQDYIPGHLAYTKLYKETYFALPGEPTE